MDTQELDAQDFRSHNRSVNKKSVNSRSAQEIPPPLLSIEDLANRLNVSQNHVRRLVKRKRLPYVPL